MGQGDWETIKLKKRYNAIGPFYDSFEWPLERLLFEKLRRRLFEQVPAGLILEVGVGTGINIPLYPASGLAIGVDLSERMVRQAVRKAARLKRKVDLLVMDAQSLGFPDYSFDAVVASLVFCSMPDPLKGLQEIKRVLKPSGRLFLMEHVRPADSGLGRLFDRLTFFSLFFLRDYLNRETVATVTRAGFRVEREEGFYRNILKLIVAFPQRN